MTIMAAATAMYACPECGVLELFDDEHIGLEGRVLRCGECRVRVSVCDCCQGLISGRADRCTRCGFVAVRSTTCRRALGLGDIEVMRHADARFIQCQIDRDRYLKQCQARFQDYISDVSAGSSPRDRATPHETPRRFRQKRPRGASWSVLGESQGTSADGMEPPKRQRQAAAASASASAAAAAGGGASAPASTIGSQPSSTAPSTASSAGHGGAAQPVDKAVIERRVSACHAQVLALQAEGGSRDHAARRAVFSSAGMIASFGPADLKALATLVTARSHGSDGSAATAATAAAAALEQVAVVLPQLARAAQLQGAVRQARFASYVLCSDNDSGSAGASGNSSASFGNSSSVAGAAGAGAGAGAGGRAGAGAGVGESGDDGTATSSVAAAAEQRGGEKTASGLLSALFAHRAAYTRRQLQPVQTQCRATLTRVTDTLGDLYSRLGKGHPHGGRRSGNTTNNKLTASRALTRVLSDSDANTTADGTGGAVAYPKLDLALEAKLWRACYAAIASVAFDGGDDCC